MSNDALDRSSEPPVLAIVNARVWTGEPTRPWADAVLVRGDRILAVGSSAELRKRGGPSAKLIDARGMMALPARAGDTLTAGAPASLLIVDRAPSADPGASADEPSVVLSLIDGRIVVDRDSIAR